jgi:hypothetical protein
MVGDGRLVRLGDHTMNPRREEQLLLGLRSMAAITAASGAMQTLRPGYVLGTIAHEESPLGRHLFATVGMFMTVSGATLHRTLAPVRPDPQLVRWAATQKVAASLAVGIGVRHGLFRRRALGVAAFDLASAIACFAYAQILKSKPSD